MLAMALILAAAAAQPAARRAPIFEPSEPEVRALRAAALAWAGEPSVQAVQRAAAAQLDAEWERLDSLRGRARQAAWLPRLRAEADHDERSTHSTGYRGSTEFDTLRLTPGTRVGLSASWELDRLVFSRDELAVAEAASRLARQREDRVERATRLFFQRLHLKAGLSLAPPEGTLERVRGELELSRTTAELDAITGGLFRAPAPPGAGGR